MILILLLIFIVTNNQTHNSHHSLHLQESNSSLLSARDLQPSREEEYLNSYLSVDDNNHALNIVIRSRYNILTSKPKSLYNEHHYQYYYDQLVDEYEAYMKKNEEDPNKWKKLTCGVTSFSIFSVLGCLLFHCI